MPRTPKPRKPAEETQPALFGPESFPDLPKLVEATKRFLHSGKITCKDEERAAAIAQAFLESGRVLAVAKRFSISPNTVHAVLRVLEQEGKLDGIKERVSQSLGLLAEVSAERAIQMVAEDRCPANVLPIMMGVSLDKKALLDGEATQRVESVQVAALDVADVVAYLARKGVTVDLGSTVSARLAEGTEADRHGEPHAPGPAEGGGGGGPAASEAGGAVGLNGSELAAERGVA